MSRNTNLTNAEQCANDANIVHANRLAIVDALTDSFNSNGLNKVGFSSLDIADLDTTPSVSVRLNLADSQFRRYVAEPRTARRYTPIISSPSMDLAYSPATDTKPARFQGKLELGYTPSELPLELQSNVIAMCIANGAQYSIRVELAAPFSEATCKGGVSFGARAGLKVRDIDLEKALVAVGADHIADLVQAYRNYTKLAFACIYGLVKRAHVRLGAHTEFESLALPSSYASYMDGSKENDIRALENLARYSLDKAASVLIIGMGGFDQLKKLLGTSNRSWRIKSDEFETIKNASIIVTKSYSNGAVHGEKVDYSKFEAEFIHVLATKLVPSHATIVAPTSNLKEMNSAKFGEAVLENANKMLTASKEEVKKATENAFKMIEKPKAAPKVKGPSKDEEIKELQAESAEKDATIAEKDAIIAELKAQLEAQKETNSKPRKSRKSKAESVETANTPAITAK